MRGSWRFLIIGACLGTLPLAGFCSTTRADGWFPMFQGQTSVEKLAHHLDVLEKHVDCYGSIVAKAPDIWGQARLTKHRHEFEKQMAGELANFSDTLNASISRSDQAFLASATSLGVAVSGPQAYVLDSKGAPTGNAITPPAVNTQVVNGLIPNLTTQTVNPDGTIANTTAKDTSTFIFQTAPGQPLKSLPGFNNSVNLKLEPTLHLDQMARYLNHLHELRRINEGDDTADSPGYSLNLVRIPISVLPGRKTRKGYGAEITITATPYISDELLPHTFRSLVINDLVDLISFKVAKIVEAMKLAEQQPMSPPTDQPVGSESLGPVLLDAPRSATTSTKPRKSTKRKIVQVQGTDVRPIGMVPAGADRDKARRNDLSKYYSSNPTSANVDVQAVVDAGRVAATNAVKSGNHGRVRRSRSPIPPTQTAAVLGVDDLADISKDVFIALNDQIRPPLYQPNLLDVRAMIRDELDAAYDMLTLQKNDEVWNSAPGISYDLAVAIRDGKLDDLRKRKESFLNTLGEVEQSDPPQAYVTTRALAWAVLVESLLLNEQLVQDMKRVAAERNCPCVASESLAFYGRDPLIEARMAFVEYVRCRWPIHVFAVDPVAQDQNVADAFSRRRELQLALALAFASGQINAQNMTRYVRRLELDMETISLNRTIVGFSHGSDTFGWRFMPRVQSPPEQGNLKVFFGDLLLGGPTRDADLRQRQLEPGMRECTAIVIMPSFVPYVTFDTRSNWFPLANCKKPEITVKDSVKLSKLIRSMQDSVQLCVRDEHKYRDGELHRLFMRVDQLSGELPMQTQTVQVPYENSLGGFEMFSNGTSDLAPQLLGFYGEPGIDPARDTHLFLIGDHFSVHETRVIAGNKPVEFRLLSRQVMEATIPAGVQRIKKLSKPAGQPPAVDSTGYVVDVHIATPYGMSSHLEVPVVRPDELAPQPGAEALGFRWATTDSLATYTYHDGAKDATPSKKWIANAVQPTVPNELAIAAPEKMIDLGAATIQLTLTTADNTIIADALELQPINFDAHSNRYVIGGANFTAIHTIANSQKLMDLISNYPDDLRNSVEVRIYAKFKSIANSNTPPIDGFHTLTVKLKKLY